MTSIGMAIGSERVSMIRGFLNAHFSQVQTPQSTIATDVVGTYNVSLKKRLFMQDAQHSH
jgi:hypothetical protein